MRLLNFREHDEVGVEQVGKTTAGALFIQIDEIVKPDCMETASCNTGREKALMISRG